MVAKFRHEYKALFIRVKTVLHNRRHIRGRKAETIGQVVEALGKTAVFNIDKAYELNDLRGAKAIWLVVNSQICYTYFTGNGKRR